MVLVTFTVIHRPSSFYDGQRRDLALGGAARRGLDVSDGGLDAQVEKLLATLVDLGEDLASDIVPYHWLHRDLP